MLASMQRLLLAASSSSSSSMQVAAGATQLLQRCCFSNSAAKSAKKQQQQGDEQSLTPEQQQHLRALHYLVQRPLEAARNAAMLTALTASYRDLYAIMDQMHKKDILGIPRPLVDDPPAAGAAALSSSSEQQQQPVTNHTQMFYPVRDFTMLPDQPPPAGGWLRNHLQERYMTRITAFAQLLPNHLEVSYQTGSQIFLWPPMEAYYPGMFDFESMLRYLQPGQKLKRTKRSVRNKRSRCKLGFQRTTPYHKQRVI